VRAATLARLSLVALVAATFLAIFYAQELKREKKLLLRPYPGVEMFEPGGGGKAVSGFDEEAHFSVRASVPDTLEVSIVSERTHRTVFVTNVRVREYRSVPVTWDGRTAAGTPAPPGDYRLSIHFRDRDRTVQATLTLDLLRPRG
jgi:hypothetical protein